MTAVPDPFDLIGDDREYAQLMWRRLTVPERRGLSCFAGAPMVPHHEVRRRLLVLGLIAEDLTVTDAGRTVVRSR